MKAAQPANTPNFQRIKDYLLGEIQAGVWKEGDVIPSEEALGKQFGVSRMTVNRAVRELSTEKILTRIQGSGTYVAQPKIQATLLEIKNIADEIAARGHTHRSELHQLERIKAPELLANKFEIKAGQPLFHSVIVHFENDIPIQVEERWVNPMVAPAYMQQDFSKITPNEFLMAVAPLQGAQYQIEALIAPPAIVEMLETEATEPCLVLKRKTSSMGLVASISTLWHPGLRYQFAGSY